LQSQLNEFVNQIKKEKEFSKQIEALANDLKNRI
jgi:hypothetical protein